MTHTTDDPSTAGGVPKADSAVAAHTSDTPGGITISIKDEQFRVFDAETGEEFKDDPEFHRRHDTDLVINANGEPELYDTRGGRRVLMVEHMKYSEAYREPVKRSDRLIDAGVIYYWTYAGTLCNCVWSNGKHVGR
jgi:hypothetical protein